MKGPFQFNYERANARSGSSTSIGLAPRPLFTIIRMMARLCRSSVRRSHSFLCLFTVNLFFTHHASLGA